VVVCSNDGHVYTEEDSLATIPYYCCFYPGTEYVLQVKIAQGASLDHIQCSFNIADTRIISCEDASEEPIPFVWDIDASVFPTVMPSHIVKNAYYGMYWVRSLSGACRPPYHESISPQLLVQDGCVPVIERQPDGTLVTRNLKVYCLKGMIQCFWGLGAIDDLEDCEPEVFYGPINYNTCTLLPEFPESRFWIGDPFIMNQPSVSPTTIIPTVSPSFTNPSKSPTLFPTIDEPSLTPTAEEPSVSPTPVFPTIFPTGSGLFISQESGLWAQRDLICASEGGVFSSPKDMMEHKYIERTIQERGLIALSDCEGPFVNIMDDTPWNRWPAEDPAVAFGACYSRSSAFPDESFWLREAAENEDAYFVCETAEPCELNDPDCVGFDECIVSGDLVFIPDSGNLFTFSGVVADFSGSVMFSPIVLTYLYMGIMCEPIPLDYRGRYALIEADGSCAFDLQYANTIAAGFEGVIYFDSSGGPGEFLGPLISTGEQPSEVYESGKPAIAVSTEDGIAMRDNDSIYGQVELLCNPMQPSLNPTFSYSPSVSPTQCEFGYVELKYFVGENPELESVSMSTCDDQTILCEGGPYASDTPEGTIYTYECCIDPTREVRVTMTPESRTGMAEVGGSYRFPTESDLITNDICFQYDPTRDVFPSSLPTYIVGGGVYGGYAWLRSTDPNSPCDLPFYQDINEGNVIFLEGYGCSMVPYVYRDGETVENQMRAFRVKCYSNNDCYWGMSDIPNSEECDIQTWHGPVPLNTCATYDEHSDNMFFIGKDNLLKHPSTSPTTNPSQQPIPSSPTLSPSVTQPSKTPSIMPSMNPSTLAPTDISGLHAYVEINFRDIRNCSEAKLQLSEMKFYKENEPLEMLQMSVPSNNHPYAGEYPMRMTDGDTWTKWVEKNFECTGYESGLLLIATLEDIPDEYLFTTGNDAPERDPVTWSISICRPNYAEPGETCVGSFVKDYPAPLERETDYEILPLDPIGPTQAPSSAPFILPDCSIYTGDDQDAYIECLKEYLKKLQRETSALRQEYREQEEYGRTCDSIVEDIESMTCPEGTTEEPFLAS